MLGGLLAGCGVERVEYDSFDEVREAGSSVILGLDETLEVLELLHENFPEAQIAYYHELNGYQAVQSGKIEAYVDDIPTMQTAIKNGLTGVKVLDEPLVTNDVVCALSSKCTIPDFENRVNSFIAKIKEDGTLDDIYQRWLHDGDYNMPDLPVAENPEYTLVITTIGSDMPFSYYQDGKLAGTEIEFAYRLAYELNAKPVFEIADWDGMVAGVATGKYDICISDLYYSDYKKTNAILSDPYYQANVGLMVQDFQEETGGLGNRLLTGFENTLIIGGRWKMLLKGLGVTMIITAGGFALANVLGAGLCAMALSRRRLLRAIENAYSKLMQGMPIVVVLMILYYILFSGVKVSGILIAIVGFGITGAAYMSQIFTGALKSVSMGQREAAMALGAGKWKTFKEIVFPQAAVNALPGYFSQLVSMMKETAIVGYIAVMDLTKASDIIRGATFDAIIPLICAALVYIIMAALLISAMNLILKKIGRRCKVSTGRGSAVASAGSRRTND